MYAAAFEEIPLTRSEKLTSDSGWGVGGGVPPHPRGVWVREVSAMVSVWFIWFGFDSP